MNETGLLFSGGAVNPMSTVDISMSRTDCFVAGP